jgi:hypothetical protein
MVSEHHSEFDQGQIPAHHVSQVNEALSMSARQQTIEQSQKMRLLQDGISLDFLGLDRSRSIQTLVDSNFQMLSNHYMSYNKFSKTYCQYELPSVEDPSTQLTSHRFYELSGFWPEQVHEICQEMALIPGTLVCPSTRCTASKELALFIALCRWHIPNSWELVGADLRHQCGWCIQIYSTMFDELCKSHACVRVLDYRRIAPLLSTWSDMTVHFTDCERDVLFFTDGKPWRLSRPGKGRAAQELCAAAGMNDLN